MDVKAVHIMEELEANYTQLQKKWKKHLPLRQKTGDPLEDLKRIFLKMFDRQVGLLKEKLT